MCYILRMATSSPPSRYTAEQLEFTFSPQVSMDMRVERLKDGRVLLTPSAEVMVWCSTSRAAEELGKSIRWVQEALLAGFLHGERLGKNWRVDFVHLQELKKNARNF